ncbi:MAG: ParB/RepB/Spo0J family partition protein [Candidatus Cyclobacteriaceae bacterium M3_2C_046]
MAEKKPIKRRNALGRGLGALLDDSDSQEKQNLESSAINSISEIPLEEIEANPFQPRSSFDQEALEELAESIKIQGIIQPITVRRLQRNKYQLISGERRLQASKIAGLTTIPTFVRIANDQQMLEMALIENIQRENLNAIEIALSYQRLLSECSLKQEELGDRVGKNRTTVNNYLRLLKLPPDIQVALRDNQITMGHARALINVDNVDLQLSMFKKIVKEDLSVRKTEALVRSAVTGGDKVKAEKSATNTEEAKVINQLQSQLSSHFGTKINIKSDQNHKGEIKIPFTSQDDLNRILEILDIRL